MITIDSNLISDYAGFISGAVDSFLPLIGMTAGIFLAFMIFERVVRAILKAIK